jgi:hypothetical protein
VDVLGQHARDGGADTLRGTIGGEQVRMLVLQRLQLAEMAIVLGVRDFGGVEDVVGVVRALDLLPQPDRSVGW